MSDQHLEHDDRIGAADTATETATDTALEPSSSGVVGPAEPGGGRRRSLRRVDRGLLLASLAIAVGLVIVIWGMFTAVTGDEGIDRPDAIEGLSPVENAIQVLQQEAVVVDLRFGYMAQLTIDGIELPTTTIGQIEVEPGAQIEFPPTAIFDPGNSIISFQPTAGAPIESFSAGQHTVRLTYWRIEDGPEAARTYTWSFNAI